MDWSGVDRPSIDEALGSGGGWRVVYPTMNAWVRMQMAALK
jgi:hypothetical protein